MKILAKKITKPLIEKLNKHEPGIWMYFHLNTDKSIYLLNLLLLREIRKYAQFGYLWENGAQT